MNYDEFRANCARATARLREEKDQAAKALADIDRGHRKWFSEAPDGSRVDATDQQRARYEREIARCDELLTAYEEQLKRADEAEGREQ